MSTINQARFTINGTPSVDPGTGDRLFIATNAQVLTVELEQDPSSVLSVLYEVFDPADPESPLASKGAPLLTFVENGLPAILLGPPPYGINDPVTVVMPATGFHSYILRATVSTAGNGTPASQVQVYERLVVILSIAGTPPFRKPVPYENTEGNARGINDTLDDMMEAVLFYVGGGGFVAPPANAVQFNAAGIFGGSADFTYDDGTKQLGLNGYIELNHATAHVGMQQTTGDASAFLNLSNLGSNPGSASVHVGDRDPNGFVSAPHGSLYVRCNNAGSTLYINQSVGTGTVWVTVGGVLTAIAPVNVTKAAAAVGVSAFSARSDHKHDISTDIAGAILVGDAAAEGVATTLARSDHKHSLGAPAAPANVTKSAAVAGVATTVARADHKHDVSTAAPGTAQVGDLASEGVSTSLARADHTHALPAPAAPANVTKAAASAGVATAAARADHKHDVNTAAPAQGIGGGNTEGVATTLARSDHDHMIRETGGPTDLTVAVIADGQTLARSGTTIDGYYPLAHVFIGGATMGAGDTGKHFEAQASSGGGKSATLSPANQIEAPFTGTIRKLAWNSATADGSTVLKINIAGVVVSTHNLTGVAGVLTIAVAVTEGQLVAVEFDAGTAPGATNVQLYASRTP